MFAKRIARLRSKLLATIGPESLASIARSMLREARNGDVAAARLLFEYTLGKAERHHDEPSSGPHRPFVFDFHGPVLVVPVDGRSTAVLPAPCVPALPARPSAGGLLPDGAGQGTPHPAPRERLPAPGGV